MLVLTGCTVPLDTEDGGEEDVSHTGAWSYAGDTGPEHWGSLAPEFAVCGYGVSQSPIDLTDDTQAKRHDLAFHYAPSSLVIANTGHTLHTDYAPGSWIVTGGQRYDLLQFHFHHLSEHTINGVAADMELHLVHSDADGQLAVVGVLLNEGPPNALLQRMWQHLPIQPGQDQLVDGGAGNIVDMVPAEQSYYSYTGSLTTPPCTENVQWFVLSAPLTVSAEQIARFAELFPNNARPVQPLHDRIVHFSYFSSM